MRFRSVVCCGGLAPLLIAAAQPVRLQPSSPWDVDYGAESCRLIRMFGQGKNQVKLAFESPEPGTMDMLVVGAPLRTMEQRVDAWFLPPGRRYEAGNVAQTTSGGEPAILWGEVSLEPEAEGKQRDQEAKAYRARGVRPPAKSLAEQARRKQQRQAFAAAVTEILIGTRRNHPVVLETGSLGAAIKAFDQCGRDSMKDWGVDPDIQDQIVRPVWTSNPGHWLSSEDYPPDLVRRGEESEVMVRLLIDASGKVTRCTPLTHFSEQEFSRITCAAITKRARFEPAELADGTKVPSYDVSHVSFRIAP